MPTTIQCTLKAAVDGGPRSVVNHAVEVDAYDRVDATIEAGDEVELAVQPSGSTDDVHLLFITASAYSDDVTYDVGDGSGQAETDVKLDGPQLFLGTGATGVLGAAPDTLTVDNGGADPVTVSILVGRVATSSA